MTPEFWAIIVLFAGVAYVGDSIEKSIRAAARERRADHEQLMGAIENLASELADIGMNVTAIEKRVNPFDPADYD